MISSYLLERLFQVRVLRFAATSALQTAWNGEGTGSVQTELTDSDVLIFRENGEWAPETGRPLRFHNVYRWSKTGRDSVCLEHLRFGPDKPVKLFELVAESPELWTSPAPHHCGDDLYSAVLKVGEDKIDLQWTIRGPRKDERIHYIYSGSED